MRWSRSSLRMALKLQLIERARREAARARLSEARSSAEEASEARREAEGHLAEAEQDWSAHLAGGALDIELGRGFAAHLVASEQALDSRRTLEVSLNRVLEREQGAWRATEASVRSGERVLSRGRRALARRSEARREQELGERTSWGWFSR